MRKTSGLSLLLLIFLSLCLITFSLLSVSESSADRKLSTKAADRTIEYYVANTNANERLAEIDAQLASYLREAETSADPAGTYLALCDAIGEKIPDVAVSYGSGSESTSITKAAADSDSAPSAVSVTDSDSNVNTTAAADSDLSTGAQSAARILSYQVPVTDTQHLQVTLAVDYPEQNSDTLYRVTEWKIVNTREWHPDTSMNLLRTD